MNTVLTLQASILGIYMGAGSSTGTKMCEQRHPHKHLFAQGSFESMCTDIWLHEGRFLHLLWQ